MNSKPKVNNDYEVINQKMMVGLESQKSSRMATVVKGMHSWAICDGSINLLEDGDARKCNGSKCNGSKCN